MTELNYTNLPSPKTPENVQQVITSFNEVRSVVNGQLDADNIADGSLTNAEISTSAAIALSKLAITPMARVFHTANQVISTTNTVVAFNSERYDTAGLHSTATNNSRLTAPVAGVYRIFFNGYLTDASGDGIRVEAMLRVNGATVIARLAHSFTSGVTLSEGLMIATEYALAVNNYVEVVMTHQQAGTSTLEVSGNASPEFGMSLISRLS